MPQGKVRLRTVSVGRNFGETVEVLDGIADADRLVLNPSDSLADGDEVAVAPTRRERPRRRPAKTRLARTACERGALARCVHRRRAPLRRCWPAASPAPTTASPALDTAGGVEGRGAVAREPRPTTPRPRGRGGSASATPQLDALERAGAGQQPDASRSPSARLAQARAVARRDLGGAAAAARPGCARGAPADLGQPAADPTTRRPISRPCRTTSRWRCRSATRSISPGRVQRIDRRRRASAEQSAADLENTRLLLTTDLATAYFNLRATRHRARRAARAIALQRARSSWCSARHDLGAATGPRRRAAAGAARHHADAGRRAASASAASSSTRSPR